MKKLTLPILAVAFTAALLAGCGSSGGGGGSATKSAAGIDGVKVGNCLNENDDFLVQPSTDIVNGQSPAGVSFTLTFYKDQATATAVFKKKNPKTTSLVENGVVDFKGNPSPYAGAPPAKISKTELGDINACIEQAKK